MDKHVSIESWLGSLTDDSPDLPTARDGTRAVPGTRLVYVGADGAKRRCTVGGFDTWSTDEEDWIYDDGVWVPFDDNPNMGAALSDCVSAEAQTGV